MAIPVALEVAYTKLIAQEECTYALFYTNQHTDVQGSTIIGVSNGNTCLQDSSWAGETVDADPHRCISGGPRVLGALKDQ